MATYTASRNLYTQFKLGLGKKRIDLSTETLKVLLTTSSYTPAVDTHDYLDDITNEVSGNGYARQTVTATWSNTGSTCALVLTDPVFTASSGSITARYWVLFSDAGATDSAKVLIAYGLVNSSNADVVTTDGNTLTLDFSASGLFTL